MQIRYGVAQVNGTQLYYELTGTGPPLVLIHGSALDRRMWDAQLRSFAQHYQVLRYDRRGFGRSALPTADTYSHHEDLKALLEHVGIAQPALLGHSTGGAVALDFALAYPDTPRALILYGSIVKGCTFSPVFAESLASIRKMAQATGIAAAKQPWLALLDFQPIEQTTGYTTLTEILADYGGWHWMNQDPERVTYPPAIEQLARISLPVLIILGERDKPDLHRIATVLQQEIPRTYMIILARVGHLASMEDPQAFNQAVLRFLAQA
jgi:pimeloyl-ACP methyl ester carboxylesterase